MAVHAETDYPGWRVWAPVDGSDGAVRLATVRVFESAIKASKCALKLERGFVVREGVIPDKADVGSRQAVRQATNG